MKKYETHILAVTSESVDRAVSRNKGQIKTSKDDNHGLIRFNKQRDPLPFDVNDVFIAPRDMLEVNECFMQVIPYCVVMRDGKILSYTRTKKGGESKLHDNVSIGFGGHIDVGDVSTIKGGQAISIHATIGNAVMREISEELNVDTSKLSGFNAVGLIVDRSNEVGRVHVGIVVIIEVDGMVTSDEDQIDLNQFKTKRELLDSGYNFENWSSILLNGDLFE